MDVHGRILTTAPDLDHGGSCHNRNWKARTRQAGVEILLRSYGWKGKDEQQELELRGQWCVLCRDSIDPFYNILMSSILMSSIDPFYNILVPINVNFIEIMQRMVPSYSIWVSEHASISAANKTQIFGSPASLQWFVKMKPSVKAMNRRNRRLK